MFIFLKTLAILALLTGNNFFRRCHRVTNKMVFAYLISLIELAIVVVAVLWVV